MASNSKQSRLVLPAPWPFQTPGENRKKIPVKCNEFIGISEGRLGMRIMKSNLPHVPRYCDIWADSSIPVLSDDVIDVTPKWSKNRLIVQWMIWWYADMRELPLFYLVGEMLWLKRPDVNVRSANLNQTWYHIIQLFFVVWNALCLLIFLATLTLSSVFSPQSLWTMGHPLFFLGESHSTQGRWSLGKDYGLIDLEETSATWTDSYLSCAAAWLGKS